MKENGLTYETLADRIGSHKGNLHRDLNARGLGKASMERIHKIAGALDLQFIPLLLPRNAEERRTALLQLLKTHC